MTTKPSDKKQAGSAHALDRYPDVLTIGETARILRLSKQSVYRAVRAERITSVRINRRVLIAKREIRRLMRE